MEAHYTLEAQPVYQLYTKVCFICALGLFLFFVPLGENADIENQIYRIINSESKFYDFLFSLFKALSLDAMLLNLESYESNLASRYSIYSLYVYNPDSKRLLVFLVNIPAILVIGYLLKKISIHLGFNFKYATLLIFPPLLQLASSFSLDIANIITSLFVCFLIVKYKAYLSSLTIVALHFFYLGDKGVVVNVLFIAYYWCLSSNTRFQARIFGILLAANLLLFNNDLLIMVTSSEIPIISRISGILKDLSGLGTLPYASGLISMFSSLSLTMTYYLTLIAFMFSMVEVRNRVRKIGLSDEFRVFLWSTILMYSFFVAIVPSISSLRFYPQIIVLLFFYTSVISLQTSCVLIILNLVTLFMYGLINII